MFLISDGTDQHKTFPRCLSVPPCFDAGPPVRRSQARVWWLRGQFGMRASPYTPPILETFICVFLTRMHLCANFGSNWLRSMWVIEPRTWQYCKWNCSIYEWNREAWLNFWILRVFHQKKYTGNSGSCMPCTEVKSQVFNIYENSVENFWQEEKASKMKPEAADRELSRLPRIKHLIKTDKQITIRDTASKLRISYDLLH